MNWNKADSSNAYTPAPPIADSLRLPAGPQRSSWVTLQKKRFDCILIGAGVRTIPRHFILFEKLLNIVHEHAPQARICFNTRPGDTAEAVQRWTVGVKG